MKSGKDTSRMVGKISHAEVDKDKGSEEEKRVGKTPQE
jgi:hypothetical protein